MINKNIFILIIFISFNSYAQRVYWASEVLEFSSELSQKEYAANQVLGKPNAMPQGGDNPNAWMPSRPNNLDFISVAFDKAIRIEQIVIAESYNPSAVYEIYLYDKKGTEYLVHSFEPKPIDLKSRLLHIKIDKTTYPVKSLKIVVDGRKVPGYCGIDAIGVSGSKKPIKVTIEQPQNLIEDIAVERLSENVNSKFEETRPLIAPDGKTLYFSRANHPENIGGIKDENDIWYSELNNETGIWDKSKNLGSELNNKGPNYISSITPDGNAMTVLLGNQYTKSNKMKPGVSISVKTSAGWSQPQPIEIINDLIETTDGNYFLANNRKVMIMAINRFDAFGEKDLFVSFLQEDNKWTEPLNLGNDINTVGMESSPYLAADNETLYFSSKGYSGYGGNDVFISRRLDDTWTNWTEPENLGPEINSIGDDAFFTIPTSGKFAYYSKSRDETNSDIYKIAMPIFYQPAPIVRISGKVVDASTSEPISAKISFKLLPENSDIGFTLSDTLTGEYEILLPAGSAYKYKSEARGYIGNTAQIDLVDEEDFREIERIISLAKGEDIPNIIVKKDNSDTKDIVEFISGSDKNLIRDSSILFEFGSDKLPENAYPLLDEIINYLKDNPSVELVISGHADNIGSEEFNQSLSVRRAQSVLDYLIKNGLDKSCFEINGYGFQKPKATNDYSEGRNKNRRVEFSVKE
jgi:OOP family OmpA-OmpF porin